MPALQLVEDYPSAVKPSVSQEFTHASRRDEPM
jgi:hypothetical protein